MKEEGIIVGVEMNGTIGVIDPAVVIETKEMSENTDLRGRKSQKMFCLLKDYQYIQCSSMHFPHKQRRET
jgi:hypothetical protein